MQAAVKTEDNVDEASQDEKPTQKRSVASNQTNSALVQRNLELHLSKDAQEKIQEILNDVKKLSDKEKLLLYLKLPTKTGLQEGDGQPIPLSNTRQEQTQAFQWIRSHLEECDSSYTLPKHEVYDDYKVYCESLASSRTLSAPDFGKIIKCVFPKVKARRLGTRGNSKYCYSGLRKKITQISPSLPSLKPDEKNSEVNNNTEEQNNEISEDQTLSAACVLVCEWANKLLGRVFTTLIELARFLVGGSYVSTKSIAAFVVMSATESKVQRMNSKLVFSPTLSSNGENRLPKVESTHITYSSPIRGRPQSISSISRTPTPQESQIVPKTPTSMRKDRGQHVPTGDTSLKQSALLMSPPPVVPSRTLVPQHSPQVLPLEVTTSNFATHAVTSGNVGKLKQNGVTGVVYIPNSERAILGEPSITAQSQISAGSMKPAIVSSFNRVLNQQNLQSPKQQQAQSPQKQLKILYPQTHAQVLSPTTIGQRMNQLSKQQPQYSVGSLSQVTTASSHPIHQPQQEKQAPTTPTHRHTHVSRTPPMRRSESCPYPALSPRGVVPDGSAATLIQSPLYLTQGHSGSSPQPLASSPLTPRRHSSWPAQNEATAKSIPQGQIRGNTLGNTITKDLEISTPYKPPPLQRCHSVPAPPPSTPNERYQTLTPNHGSRVAYSPARLSSQFDHLREIRSKIVQPETSRVRRNLTAVLDGDPSQPIKPEPNGPSFSRTTSENIESLIDVPFTLDTEFTDNPSELNDLDGLDDAETVELLKSLDGGDHMWGNEWPSASLPLMETS